MALPVTLGLLALLVVLLAWLATRQQSSVRRLCDDYPIHQGMGPRDVFQELFRSHLLPALSAADKLGVFEKLSQARGKTFQELAAELGASEKGLDALLATLVEFGHVRVDDRTQRLSSLPNGGLEPQLLAVINGYQEATQRQFYYIAESVRSGKAEGLTNTFGDFSSIYQARAQLPEVAKYWDPWMDAWNRHFEEHLEPMLRFSQQVNGKQTGRSEFRILDWCGNKGDNALRTSRLIPTAHVTVMDLPEQCAKADIAIKEAGMESRIRSMPVDLESSEFTGFQEKFDACYMVHTIREWNASAVQRFFNIVYDSLQTPGMLYVDTLSPRKLGSFSNIMQYSFVQPTLQELYFLTSASHEQYMHHSEDVRVWLEAAGFKDVKLLLNNYAAVAYRL